ncbi:histidine--tRNA ligase [Candidatus Zixiibacteriota bacterium]
MTENRLLQSIRGTRDLLPGETEAWDVVEGIIREVMGIYQYREIRTPLFEDTQLFARGIGEHTDIVNKEMYTFDDQGGRSLTLRPEGTASVVRSWLQHKLGAQGTVNKLYYLGPMFRQEAPQKGRARQFHQFGAEVLGTDAPEADAEIILLLLAVLDALGLDTWALHIGSLGCRECRPAYREVLVEFLAGVEDLLCEDCRERMKTNPIRVLDCKVEGCRLATGKAPSHLDHLDEGCQTHFNAVQTLLGDRGIPYTVDPRLVRGLDYYERTTFEVLSPDLGAQDAICGGGRYDGLAQMIGGSDRVPGVGFAAGIERIMLALEAAGVDLDFEPICDVALIHIGEAARQRLFALCDTLRRAGVACTIELFDRSVKAQMREANRREAMLALIVGENELEAGMVTVKNLVDSEEEQVPLDSIISSVLEKLELMDSEAVDEDPEEWSEEGDALDPEPGEAA